MFILNELLKCKSQGQTMEKSVETLRRVHKLTVSSTMNYPGLYLFTTTSGSDKDLFPYKNIVLFLHAKSARDWYFSVESVGFPITRIQNKDQLKSTPPKYSVREKMDGDLVSVWYSEVFKKWMYHVDGTIMPDGDFGMGMAVSWKDFIEHYIISRLPQAKTVNDIVESTHNYINSLGSLTPEVCQKISYHMDWSGMSELVGCTYFLEACSRQSVKVVPHRGSKVVLIGVRSCSGGYPMKSQNDVSSIAKRRYWETPDCWTLKQGLSGIVDIIKYCKSASGREGYMLYDDNTNMPLKAFISDWYRNEVKNGRLLISALATFRG